MALQRSLLQYLRKDYLALVSSIEMIWKDKTTNLNDTIIQVTCHIKINRGNKKDSIEVFTTKVLATNIHRIPKATCIAKEYVK